MTDEGWDRSLEVAGAVQERGHTRLVVAAGNHKGADRNGWICKARPPNTNDRAGESWQRKGPENSYQAESQRTPRLGDGERNTRETWGTAGRWASLGGAACAGRTQVFIFSLRCNTGRKEELVLRGPGGLRNHFRNKQKPPFVHEGLQGFTEQVSCRTVSHTLTPWTLWGTRERGCRLSIRRHLPGRSLLLVCFSFLTLTRHSTAKGVPNCFICKEKFRELEPFLHKELAYMERIKYMRTKI